MDELDDICYECTAYGDNYYIDDKGELVCACDECWVYRSMMDEEGYEQE